MNTIRAVLSVILAVYSIPALLSGLDIYKGTESDLSSEWIIVSIFFVLTLALLLFNLLGLLKGKKQIMNKVLFLLLTVLFSTGCIKPKPDIYLFSYFVNNGEDGLHLAYSEDGLTWTALGNNESFLRPEAGVDKLMRDPCIIRGGDGRFHMAWTVSWNERGIGYACSNDLILWSEQKYIPVMHHEPEARNCWAPELYYDRKTREFLVYWSSTIPGRFPETDSTGDNGYNHRIYYTTTKDFASFDETRLLYEPGFNVIDATIAEIEGEYVMFLKNETRHPQPEKNIRIARSRNLLGEYSPASEPITENWVEGPTVIKTNMGWTVYFDRYRKREMGAVVSDDLRHWTDISDKLVFPEGTRHGTVIRVERSILDNLLKKYPI